MKAVTKITVFQNLNNSISKSVKNRKGRLIEPSFWVYGLKNSLFCNEFLSVLNVNMSRCCLFNLYAH